MIVYAGYFLLFISLIFNSSSKENTDNFTSYKLGITSSISLKLVPIKGGVFQAGSEFKADEQPEHQVQVSDLWISTYEVPWEVFELFLYRANDKSIQRTGEIELSVDAVSGATMPYVNFNKSGYPVINITQYSASQFCKWLTAITGDYYRLPTEAEWEYACKAGGDGQFPFPKDSISEYAWYAENSNDELNKCGLKKPNPYGLFDMHGNAAEWVLDNYQPKYEHLQAVDNPMHRDEDKLYPRVVRGGSYKDDVDKLRASARSYSDKSWKRRDPQFPKSLWWHTDALHVGFRIVRPRIPPDAKDMEMYWVKPIEDY